MVRLKAIFFMCIILGLRTLSDGQEPVKPNILFVVFDDLNDWAEGFGGHPQANTPNIAALSDVGTVFTNTYCSAPMCGPSRTSFMTGKDPFYTNVYGNVYLKCILSENFLPEYGNEEYFTLPGYLKDSGGYFTYGVNKLYHCYKEGMDYDSITLDPCAKELSWNKYIIHNDAEFNLLMSDMFNDGVSNYRWGRIDSVYETQMDDYKSADSVIAFFEQSAIEDITCGRPWFVSLGIKKPHFPSFSPGKYWYNEYYLDDIYAEPYQIPYNYPEGSTPFNGIVIPPTTSPIRFLDIYSLPADGIAWALSDNTDDDNAFDEFPSTLVSPPVISDTISDSLRNIILENSMRANMVMAYLASGTFADAQFGRVMDALSEYPEVYNNTVVVLIGDHGFSLGEKKHWQKATLWEQDVRTFCVVADLRNPVPTVSSHMVSLLDIFPTICDFAGIDYPSFADGTAYLDGESLLPYLGTPDRKEERPVLSSIKNKKGTLGSCYPHYSIRNSRFHLIDYTVSEGAEGTSECIPLDGEIERELYDIGIDRKTDPYEFNNLAYDPEYLPAIDYLLQWKPGNPMFLQKGLKVEMMTRKSTPCFLDSTSVLPIRLQVYDTLGNLMTLTDLSDYTITWSNSAVATEFTGPMYFWDMADVPAGFFDTNDHIMFYVEVVDNLTMNTVGFDMRSIAINPIHTPEADFDVVQTGNQVSIINYTLSGLANSFVWNFGDGYQVTDMVAAPHTYQDEGGYIIKHILEYGNKCKKTYSNPVWVDTLILKQAAGQAFHVFPNPASGHCIIEGYDLEMDCWLRVIDMAGITHLEMQLDIADGSGSFDVSSLPNGTYIVYLTSPSGVRSEKIVVLR